MNTLISYLYRDASNYKVWNACVIPGLITQEQIKQIMQTLVDGENFIPSLVGMPESRFDSWTEDDTDWFELYESSFTPVDQDATLDIPPDELVARFRKAGSTNWAFSRTKSIKEEKEKTMNDPMTQDLFLTNETGQVQLRQLSCDELRTLQTNTWIYIQLNRKNDVFAKPPESTWYRAFPPAGPTETLFRFGFPCLPYSLPYGTYGKEWVAYLMPDIDYK